MGAPASRLAELALCCERTAGADMSLDTDIWEAVGRPNEYLVRDLKLDPPDYTASVDAALTLVPEGFNREIISIVGKPPTVRLWDDDKDIRVYRAATEALAITAAALRARASAIETRESQDREDGLGAEHESATRKGDAHD